jgi:competence protein ComFC
MSFFKSLLKIVLEFLFPKSPSVINIESLSPDELLRNLPRSEQNENSNLISLFSYQDPLVREMIWELKYSGNKVVADKLGAILYDVLCAELEDRAYFEKWKAPILIPIPISDARRYERGWNQSELLAKAIKDHDVGNRFKYIPRQLVRYRHTESQTKTASRSERLTNIKDTMRVLSPDLFKDRCLILIDDVTTTGATFSEARRVLNLCDAKKIICIAVAH